SDCSLQSSLGELAQIRAFQLVPEFAERESRVAERIRGYNGFVQAFARRFDEVTRDGGAPKIRAPCERADEFANGSPEFGIAKAELAMLSSHHLNESLGKSDGEGVTGLAAPFQSH